MEAVAEQTLAGLGSDVVVPDERESYESIDAGNITGDFVRVIGIALAFLMYATQLINSKSF